MINYYYKVLGSGACEKNFINNFGCYYDYDGCAVFGLCPRGAYALAC